MAYREPGEIVRVQEPAKPSYHMETKGIVETPKGLAFRLQKPNMSSPKAKIWVYEDGTQLSCIATRRCKAAMRAFQKAESRKKLAEEVQFKYRKHLED